jgi:hypothetical protein
MARMNTHGDFWTGATGFAGWREPAGSALCAAYPVFFPFRVIRVFRGSMLHPWMIPPHRFLRNEAQWRGKEKGETRIPIRLNPGDESMDLHAFARINTERREGGRTEGRRQKADGRWQVADGRWQVAEGRWSFGRIRVNSRHSRLISPISFCETNPNQKTRNYCNGKMLREKHGLENGKNEPK